MDENKGEGEDTVAQMCRHVGSMVFHLAFGIDSSALELLINGGQTEILVGGSSCSASRHGCLFALN